MKLKKSVFFMWLKYYDPESLEHFLEKEAQAGWHPNHIDFGMLFRTNFLKGEAQSYRYVVDYQFNPASDYITTYQMFGWTLVGTFSDMYIWRMQYTGQRPEAFSNVQNRKERNRKLMYMYLMFDVICLLYTLITAVLYIRNVASLELFSHVRLLLEIGISGFLSIFLGRRIYRLHR